MGGVYVSTLGAAFSAGVVKPSQAAHLIDRHPEPSQRVKTSIELRVQIIVLGSRP